jgi:hypothetical protein
MAENGRSRVYLGIHWNFDDTEAQLTGQQIAQFIAAESFVAAAVPEPGTVAFLTGVAAVCIRRRYIRRPRHG